MDLVYADASATGASPSAVYFMMDTVNIVKQLQKPWVSLGSDGASMAPEGAFLKSSTHPRAYGNFARFLGKYVRDEKVMSLAEGVRRLSGLPAENMKLKKRERWSRGTSPTWWCSIPPRSRITRRSPIRSSIRPACATCS
jgi:N-acyl-D-amino-acid deacylase